MYQNNFSNSEFLFIFYTKTEQEINKIIELMNRPKQLSNIIEISNIKKRLLEAIYLLSTQTEDKQFNAFLNRLSLYITSTDIKNIEKAKQLCSNIRK